MVGTKQHATDLMGKHRHWQKKGIDVFVPRTVGAILCGHQQKGAPAQDCEPCPCTCTGCSEWD